MSELNRLIEGASIGDIGAWLDGRDAGTRWQALSTLSRSQQRTLYQKAAEATPLTLADFVPEDRPHPTPVHHLGRNTLPLWPSWRFFEKRFAWAPDGARLFGYNEGPTRGLVGPGYFVGRTTAGVPQWEPRGAVVIDYFQVPDGPVDPSWPQVHVNERGISRLVYSGTRDYMRRVSSHVTIGAAFKGEKALDHYFVLCRQDS